jgi:hypothetical protein
MYATRWRALSKCAISAAGAAVADVGFPWRLRLLNDTTALTCYNVSLYHTFPGYIWLVHTMVMLCVKMCVVEEYV